MFLKTKPLAIGFQEKNKDSKSAVVLSFVNSKHKAELLHKAKKLKRAGVYLNEHLTKKNANIVRHTISCHIYIYSHVRSAHSNVLFSVHCPVHKVKQNHKYMVKPWITKGLENACKKKNLSYKQFLKVRTKAAGKKYRKYMNKLVSVLKNSKKKYFHNLIEQ